MSKYPFRNLVLQGGGIKALAYHGALQVLEEEGILPQIRRVGGTSAGALLALLLAFRLSVAETIELMRTVDYGQITRSVAREPRWKLRVPEVIEEDLGRLMGGVDSLKRMLRHYGWYAHDYARGWLSQTVARYCEGNPRSKFADLRRLGHRDIYVVATNISRRSVAIFSPDHTPDVAVVDAVLLSGSIPLYFESLRFDGRHLGRGDHYADGSVLLNYPLEIFDAPVYAKDNPYFVHGVNWATLGLRLYTPPDCLPQRPIENLIHYITNLFEAMAEAQVISFENDPVDQLRSVSISNCGVSSTDFDIRPEPADPTYQALVDAGRSATRAYLEGYRLPTDRIYELRARVAELLEQLPRPAGEREGESPVEQITQLVERLLSRRST